MEAKEFGSPDSRLLVAALQGRGTETETCHRRRACVQPRNLVRCKDASYSTGRTAP